MKELETGEMEFETVEEFLTSLKKEFGGGKKESVKAAELKLIEAENQPGSIKQWYRRAMALDRNWRESRREEERIREKKEQEGGALKQEQRQNLL